MRYDKPEIVVLASATDAIKQTSKFNGIVPDGDLDPLTQFAYEADE